MTRSLIVLKNGSAGAREMPISPFRSDVAQPHRRQAADEAVDHAKEGADGFLVGRDGIKVTHGPYL